MTKNQIIGTILVAAGIGTLIYLYKGYLKPRKEFDAEIEKASSVAQTTTTKK